MKPKHAERYRQIATWVPKEMKAELEKRAAAEKKPERRVLTEALAAHLRGVGRPEESED